MLAARNLLLIIFTTIFTACGGGGGNSPNTGGNSQDYKISINQTSVAFNASLGGPSPESQQLLISYVGEVVVIGIPPGAGDLPAWLNVDVVGSQTANPLSVAISVNTNGVSEGRHSTVLRFVSTNFDGSKYAYQDISVELNVANEISLSQNSLTFSHLLGASPAIPSKTLNVNGSGFQFTVQSSQPWLSVTSSTTISPAALKVNVNPDGLALADHTATITITNTSNNFSITIPVFLTINPPKILVSRNSLSINGTNGKRITGQTIDIYLNNGDAVNWSATSTASWLLLNGTPNSTTGTSPGNLQLSIDAQTPNLSSQVYQSTIELTATSYGVNLTKTIDISLNLSPMTFRIAPTTVTMSGINGSNLGVKPIEIALDTNAYDHTWSASTDSTWLNINGAKSLSGTNSGILELTVNAATLASGSHQADIQLVASVNGDTITHPISVNLQLTQATLSVDPVEIIFNGVNGSIIEPQPASFTIDTGAELHPWSVVFNGDNVDNWLLVNNNAGDVSSTASQLQLSLDTTGLLGNVYTGTLTFTAVVNQDQVIKDVPVTLNLDPHRIFVPENGVALSHFANIPSVLTKSVTILDNDGGDMQWTAASDVSWLTITPSGTKGSELTMTANPSDSTLLPGEINYATVTLNSDTQTIENTGEEIIRVGLYMYNGLTDPAESIETPVVGPSISTPLYGMITDPIRPYVYLSNGSTNVFQYNVYTGDLVKTFLNVGSDIRQLEVSSDGSTLFAFDIGTQTIRSINLDTGDMNNDIPNSGTGANLLFEYTRTNGHPVLITNNKQIIDATNGEVLTTYPLHYSSYQIIAAKTGKVLFAQQQNSSAHSEARFSLNYSRLNGGIITVMQTHSTSLSGFGHDTATDYYGSVVYSWCRHNPPQFRALSGENMTLVSDIEGANFNYNQVEIDNSGVLLCGRSSTSATIPDIMVFDLASQTTINGFDITGNLDRFQLQVSGDGARVLTRSNSHSVLTSTSKLPYQ